MTKEETTQLNKLASQVAGVAATMAEVKEYMKDGQERQGNSY
jgi:hypothetical protein